MAKIKSFSLNKTELGYCKWHFSSTPCISSVSLCDLVPPFPQSLALASASTVDTDVIPWYPDRLNVLCHWKKKKTTYYTVSL